ncbi:MAG TPA: hypothetical protein VH395_17735 [Jatrophihabitantaceae bacterium]|jgi:hypothetical protein
MPNASRSATEIVDHGLVEVGTSELGGYTVDFLTVKQPVDMSRMLHGLPDDACQCPHWGVVVTGRMRVRYLDGREDVVAAGDAFYLPPGHVPTYDVGTELTQFSPTAELKATDEAIMRNLRELQAT